MIPCLVGALVRGAPNSAFSGESDHDDYFFKIFSVEFNADFYIHSRESCDKGRQTKMLITSVVQLIMGKN